MSSPTAPTPATILRFETMRRLAAVDAPHRVLATRRRDTARNGYRGPLTRAELAARASRSSQES
jgi:hypothetical protein